MLGKLVCEREGVDVHTAEVADGTEVLVVRLTAPNDDGVRAFKAMRKLGALGGVRVIKSDSSVAIARPGAVGTFANLSALGWPLAKRLTAFRDILLLVRNFHGKGFAVGVLDPGFILLNDDFEPMLLGPRFAPIEGPYAAPETLDRFPSLSQESDVYSLGRLLHFVLNEERPPMLEGDPAKLEDLMNHPAGLSRIIRKAVRQSPHDRYATLDELFEDLSRYGRYQEVGLAHPDVEEKNLGGLSEHPFAMPAARPKKKHDDPSEQSLDAMAATKLQEILRLQPFRLKPTTRAILLIGGVLGVATAFGINYLAGDPMWIRLALSFAAGLVGFSVASAGVHRESTLRSLMAIFCATATFAANPTPYVAQIAERAGLQSVDPAKRAKSYKAQADRGYKKFDDLDLTGADLTGRTFIASELDGTSLEGADLTDARFLGTRLDAVRFKGAKLYGTQFLESPVDQAVDFEAALCDEEALLPRGWACIGGHPVQTKD